VVVVVLTDFMAFSESISVDASVSVSFSILSVVIDCPFHWLSFVMYSFCFSVLMYITPPFGLFTAKRGSVRNYPLIGEVKRISLKWFSA